jgi:hypothetical protein
VDLGMVPIPPAKVGPEVQLPTGPFRLLLQSTDPLHPPRALSGTPTGCAQVHPKRNDPVDDGGRFDL